MFLYIFQIIKNYQYSLIRLTLLWAKAYLKIYILHSFIGHSLEERRKVLKRKQRKGIIIDIKLMYYTSVSSNMQGTRHFVRVSVFSKKNPRILITWYYSLRISNWKINSHKIKQFAKTRICQGNTQVHLQFFLQIKTLVNVERPSCYANGSFYTSS